MDIPEDDPRNPAVIADNVGDNVGDVAGMGADLFESFVSFPKIESYCMCRCSIRILTKNRLSRHPRSKVGSIIAAITLANGDVALVMLPFWVAGAGIVASMIGFFAVGTKDGANQKELMFALHKGTIVSSTLVVAFTAVIVNFLFQDREDYGWRIFSCICIGLAAGVLIGQVSCRQILRIVPFLLGRFHTRTSYFF